MPNESVQGYVHNHANPFDYPSTARAGRHAARLWFQSDSPLPAARFRDQQFEKHCEGRTDSLLDRRIRRDTFRQAFALAIGHIVVEEGRFHALAA